MATAILVTLTATIAAAREASWELIFERGGYEIYIDRATLQHSPVVRATIRHEFPQPIPARDGWPAYRSQVELRRFDCVARTSGVEQQIVFEKPSLKGKPARAVAFEDVNLERPAPGTVGAAVVDAVCRLVAS